VHYPAVGQVTVLPSDKQENLTYRVFFPEGPEPNATFTTKMVSLKDICYTTYGLRPSSDEHEAKGEFTTADLIQETRDNVHCRPYVDGKHLGRWLPATNLWIEWGTARAPARFCRPTFSEMYQVPEKLLAQRSPGPDPKACYDDGQLIFTPSSVGFIPWHYLSGIRNNSIKKAARYKDEPIRSDLPIREDLEAISRRFAVKYLLGVMNSSTARDFLRANRRSNIHLYPEDWKQLPIPEATHEEQAVIVALVDRILVALRSDPKTDVSVLEEKIDDRVAVLYGVSQKDAVTV
jgi:hypothetical protein